MADEAPQISPAMASFLDTMTPHISLCFACHWRGIAVQNPQHLRWHAMEIARIERERCTDGE